MAVGTAGSAALGEFLFHGGLFLVVELPVFICVEFFEHFFLEFSFTSLEGGLHSGLFLVVKLPVFIRVEFFEHLFLEFGFTSLEGGLHGGFFLLVKLPIFIGIKLGKNMLKVRFVAGRGRLRSRIRCRSGGCFLSHDRHGSSYQCE